MADIDKLDDGKPPIMRGVIEYFPRAIIGVSQVSAFGARKYGWNTWASVDNALARYSDAQARHLLQQTLGEEHDPESSLLHAAHEAWNSMAKLELILRGNK